MRLLVVMLLALCVSAESQVASNPKVRAITGFVRLDRERYVDEVNDALRVLRMAKAELAKEGYEVETVRITTQPLGELVAGMKEEDALKFLAAYDRLAAKENFAPSVGPAMMHDSDDVATIHLLRTVLTTMPKLRSSTIIADEAGIHWKTIHETAELVKYVAEHSTHSQGTMNFTATAMQRPLGPFFPGSYHTGPGRQFAIGMESANVVRDVFAKDKGNADAAVKDLTAALTKHAQAMERVGNEVAKATGWSYAGVDPTPAPMGDVSIAGAIEAYTGARFGSSGTMTASRLITTAVKAVPVKQTGFSGMMVPIMEDRLMAQRWEEQTFTIDALLAYSSVCGTGLDTIPLPGDVSVEQMERMYADVASLAVKWNKPLTARLNPIAGKKAGERTEFDDPTLVNTVVRPLP